MRIANHPILGQEENRKKINIIFEGKNIEAYEGEPIAATLWAANIKNIRRTKINKEARGFFCGIGLCSDCRIVVNGVPNIRSCVTLVENNMIVKRQIGNG